MYHYCISISGKINSTWFVFTQTPTFWFLLIDNSYAVFVILGYGPNRKQYRQCTCMCVSMRPCLGIMLPLIKYSQENTVGTSRGDCPFVTLRSTDMTVGRWMPAFPVDDFCKLVCLMDTGRNQNLLCVPESESCPLKIRAYLDTIR